MNKLEIFKDKYKFIIEFKKEEENNNYFLFKLQELETNYSYEDDSEVIKEYVISEDDYFRIGELIDSLKYPDMLHPITKDSLISPFGKKNRHILHIKWQGWEVKHLIDKYQQMKKINDIEQKELLVEINNMKNNLESFLKTVQPSSKPETVYRKTLHLLVNSLIAILPDSLWATRSFLPTPFRVISIKKFSDKKPLKIKLTPFESRKVIRYLEKYSHILPL